jgi:hypothetical protein
MVGEIRAALDGYPREQLQEILAWVFKEYVVEGGAAPAQGALTMLDARTELEGLSFAELVTWLQLHLDVPELAQLEVQNGRVSVRAGGRSIPIEAARAPEPPPPAAAPQPQQQPAAPPPTQAAPVAAPSPASPPAVAASQTAATPSAAPAAPSSAPAAADKKEDKKDEGAPSSRFSWLEVD